MGYSASIHVPGNQPEIEREREGGGGEREREREKNMGTQVSGGARVLY